MGTLICTCMERVIGIQPDLQDQFLLGVSLHLFLDPLPLLLTLRLGQKSAVEDSPAVLGEHLVEGRRRKKG